MVSLATKIQPMDEVITIFINEALSEAAQVDAFAEFAREKLSEAEDTNQFIFGRVPPYETIVDGRIGATEESVSPKGEIVYEFQLATDVLVWIADALKAHSPVGGPNDPHPGLYRANHLLFADGTEVAANENVPDAQVYMFVNDEPYARKLDKGYSSQFPDGVYQAVVTLAKQQFSKIAKIEFGWTSILGGNTDLALWAAKRPRTKKETASATRQPSITVTLK